MAQSIKERVAGLSNTNDARQLQLVLNAILADMTALRATVAATNVKLNADEGVTDTDYAAPSVLTTES